MIVPSFKFQRLTSGQFEALHAASLEVLARTGVRLHYQPAVEMLREAGAQVTDGNLVRVPAALVEQALQSVPHEIQLYNQQGQPAMRLGAGNCYYGTGSDCLNIIDHRSGERRRAVLQDVIDGARLGDALPQIDFLMSMFLPSDVDPDISDVLQMEILLNHSNKPIVFVTNEFQGCVDAIGMAEAVAGGAQQLAERPFVACYVNVTSGLVHNEEALQKLLFLAEKGIPFCYIPVVTLGMTGPVTQAGTMAMLNAGSLLGVVLSQLKRRGAPIIVLGCGAPPMDMKTMVTAYAFPDVKGMTHAVGHGYELPVFGLGGVSESKLLDQQAAAEAALTLMAETLNGADLVHDLGYLESGLTGSLPQLVLCNEIVSWIKNFSAPLVISDETLGLEMIDRLGPEGNFLAEEHTIAHFREHWYPELFERGNYDQWLAAGGRSSEQRAMLRVEKILAAHQPTPLAAQAAAALRAIVAQAEARL